MIIFTDLIISEIHNELQKFFQIPLKKGSVFKGLKEKYKELGKKITENQEAIMTYIEDYNLLLGFEEYIKRDKIPLNKGVLIKKENLKEFVAFACSFQRLYHAAEPIEQIKLRDSLTKGLNARLLPFQQEIETAVHLNQCQFDIKWQDGLNNNNFEYFATKDGITFAVECKVILRYAGSPIIEAAANEFAKNLDWNIIKSRIPMSSIICLSFEGELTQRPKTNTYTPDSLLEVFYSKLQKKHKDIDIRELAIPTAENHRKWLAEKITEIHREFPLAHVLFPLPLSSINNKSCFFLCLIPKSTSKYLEKFKKQLEKALQQVQGKLPGVIYLYPEGLTSSLLGEIGGLLYEVIQNKLDGKDQPLFVCVRTKFKETLNSKADLLMIHNKAFQPFLPLFNCG